MFTTFSCLVPEGRSVSWKSYHLVKVEATPGGCIRLLLLMMTRNREFTIYIFNLTTDPGSMVWLIMCCCCCCCCCFLFPSLIYNAWWYTQLEMWCVPGVTSIRTCNDVKIVIFIVLPFSKFQHYLLMHKITQYRDNTCRCIFTKNSDEHWWYGMVCKISWNGSFTTYSDLKKEFCLEWMFISRSWKVKGPFHDPQPHPSNSRLVKSHWIVTFCMWTS